MKKTRPFRWYHRLFYRWSSPYRHDVEKAHRWYIAQGYTQGYNDCLNHLPWPSEPQTDPLQQVTIPPVPLATGQFAKLVRQQQGRTIHTQIMNAIGQVQLAQLKATMQEKEGQQ